MTKEERKQKALEHHKKIISNGFTSSAKPISQVYFQNMTPCIIQADSFQAVRDIAKYNSDKICVLNFASFTSPGGGFINGAIAQEESLCHESDLYEKLSQNKEWYLQNKQFINNGAYANRALYSENIQLDTGEVCDVITCAAPNVNHPNYSQEKNEEIFKSRIKFVLDIAEMHDVEDLVLGAWGCGCFGQNPHEVYQWISEMYHSAKYNFSITFAVPKGPNYNAFYVEYNQEYPY